MALCPQCQFDLTPGYMMTHAMVCPQCHSKLGFDKKEYKQVSRPGIFIFLVLLFNVYYTVDPYWRAIVNGGIMVLWFLFLRRYIQYLKNAQLHIR